VFKRRRVKLKADSVNENLEYLQKLKNFVLQLRSIYERSAKTKIEKDVLSINKTSQKILQTLIDDNSKISGQRLLIDYYLPELVQILNQYIAIKSNNISSTSAEDTLEQIEEFIPIVNKAFKRILENIVNQRNSDIDVDIKVMLDKLSSKRLV